MTLPLTTLPIIVEKVSVIPLKLLNNKLMINLTKRQTFLMISSLTNFKLYQTMSPSR